LSLKENPHIPVLLDEVLSFINTIKDGCVLDATTGFANHSYEILQNTTLNMLCNDQDIDALEFSKNKLSSFKNRVNFTNKSFSKLKDELNDFNIKGILADIGVSSYQLDEQERGFSFDSDVLDMRMDRRNHLDAKFVVNNYSKEELINIFKEYGEVRDFQRIANAICDYRKDKEIKSSKELATLIARNTRHFSKINPATLVFQAIRIEVNAELEELKNLLLNIENANIKGLKVLIISFHSLEDRIVKQKFKEWTKKCICSSEVMRCECGNNNQKGKILTKKPITPSKKELKENPRSRSAKLRVFQFSTS
jgi:16S rRNA (cytosine1402-N4)-methyltransferase